MLCIFIFGSGLFKNGFNVLAGIFRMPDFFRGKSIAFRRWIIRNIVADKVIRPNRITISAGTSGFLLPFCSAAISGIMPQKASFLKTFSTNCHILLDIVPFRVYNKGTRKPMTQNEAIEDKTERGKLHSPIKVPKWYRSLGNETSPAPGGKDKTERGKLYSPTAVSK